MIINKTTDKKLSTTEIICPTFFSQLRGLMFRPRKNLIMIFPEEKTISLHTFFVFYPIDVLILDGDKKIIEIKRDFKPFTLWNAQKKGKYVVELNSPVISTLGDQLEFSLTG